MATYLVTMGSFTATALMVTSTQPTLKLQLEVFDSSPPQGRQPTLPYAQSDLYLSTAQLSTMFCFFPGGPIHPLLRANEFLFGKLRNVLPLCLTEEELSARGELLVSYLMDIIPYVLHHGRHVVVRCRYNFVCIPYFLAVVGEEGELVDGVLLLGRSESSGRRSENPRTTTPNPTTRRMRGYVSNSARLVLLNLSATPFLFSKSSSSSSSSSSSDQEEASASASSCAICLEDYDEGNIVSRLRCSHVFHWNCLVKWAITMQKNTCPLCRKDIILVYLR